MTESRRVSDLNLHLLLAPEKSVVVEEVGRHRLFEVCSFETRRA